MQIAIAQMNCMVGDIKGNVSKIISAIHEAKAQGASLLVTPELSLCGYPPEDLLLRQDFLNACALALSQLSESAQGITVIVGHPHQVGEDCYNAASVLEHGNIIATYHKQALPNHSVFDEKRYFKAGSTPLVFDHQGVKVGILVCADVWEPGPAKLAKAAGAECLIAINASPFHLEKQSSRLNVSRARVKETGLALTYVNMVGGQDELVFDGGSFALNAQGEVNVQLPAFTETLAICPLNTNAPLLNSLPPVMTLEASVYEALKLGLQDYVHKNKFPGVVLGLSGGVDSALTLAIAVDALGADKVHAVMMPTQFTASISIDDAHEIAENLSVQYTEIAIEPLFTGFKQSLSAQFSGLADDTTEENLQARIRGTLLMALSNKFGSIVLTTGNKSEMAVGYCTLYGDMAGGFALLKDVPKTLVYKLCVYRNGLSPVIPERIITRAPTAELRDNQLDQDSLPAYEVLDAIMQAYVEEDLSQSDIVDMGYLEEDVRRVIHLIDRNEYKRRQSPVGVRITHRGFGKDRRYPITVKLDFTKDLQ